MPIAAAMSPGPKMSVSMRREACAIASQAISPVASRGIASDLCPRASGFQTFTYTKVINGERHRVTVMGPGVTPIVRWEGKGLFRYDVAADQGFNSRSSTRVIPARKP